MPIFAEPLLTDDTPTSFGAFKPTGHLFIGLPDREPLQKLIDDLMDCGWAAEDISRFRPKESAEDLEELIDNAGAAAGFGYELPLMRRYLALSREGAHWLLVKVKDPGQASVAAERAKRLGAQVAVHYRPLIVEELI